MSRNGEVTKIRLDDVIFIPKLTVNLLSVTQVMKNGWKLCGTSTEKTIEKEGSKIRFDNMMTCDSGFVYSTKIKRKQQNAPLAKDKTSKLHGLFCRSDIQQVKRTAKDVGNYTSAMEEIIDCEDCKIGKAKQKAVPKVDQNTSKTPGERPLINMSSVKRTEPKEKFWVLVKDQATKMK